jgi:hypothetical protein
VIRARLSVTGDLRSDRPVIAKVTVAAALSV